MSDPSPDDIRKALDVLAHFGLDPNGFDHRAVATAPAVHALVKAVRALDAPPVPVTADTPAGTEIGHKAWPDTNPSWLWTDGKDLLGQEGSRTRPFFDAVDGWVEVRRPEPEEGFGGCFCDEQPCDCRPDPEPVPVRVGQVRAMPATVGRVDAAHTYIVGQGWRLLDVVESWPVISEPEEAPDGE